MIKINSILLALVMLFATVGVYADGNSTKRSQSPAATELYFITPQNGQVVGKTFAVKFGLRGMGIAPAGLDKNATGHHHILVDFKGLPDLTKSLPANDNIRHFGGGQSETTLTLSPGEHTLQLLLGDYLHIPHSPAVMSKRIKVIVK